MLEKNRIYYSYSDLLIKPARITKTEHRKEGVVLDKDGYLPLFASPMTCVVDDESYKLFEKNHIHAVYPRYKDSLEKRLKLSYGGYWAAYSLKEFKDNFCNTEKAIEQLSVTRTCKIRVLIDIANGHMRSIYSAVKACKEMWKNDIEVMVGNISNPETYRDAVEAGVDYVRLSVGTGFGCITTSQTGIGYPIASLIDDTVAVKHELIKLGKTNLPKIVADGGIRNYDDIMKALALGADYVMVGSVFCKMYESAGETRRNGVVINQHEMTSIPDFKHIEYTKSYYGMASHYGQVDMGIEKKTAEGTTKTLKCEYTMEGWIGNFIDYLRSAMSYIDCRNVADIYNKAKVIIRSQASIGAINK